MDIKEMWGKLRPEFFACMEDGRLTESVVIDFCETTRSTLKTWTEVHRLNSHQPVGDTLIRLWHLVEAAGGNLPDLYVDRELNRYVTELFVYGVVPFQEIKDDILGMTGEDRRVFEKMRGSKIGKAPIFSLADLVTEYGARLAEAKADEAKKRQFAKPMVEKSTVELVEEATADELDEMQAMDEIVSSADVEIVDVALPLEVLDGSLEQEDESTALMSQSPGHWTLEVAKAMSGILPLLRMAAFEVDGDFVTLQTQLRYLMGLEGVMEVADAFGLEPVQETLEVLYEEVTPDLIERIAELLREVAPLLRVLFKDSSPEADEAREQLRTAVGPQLYSELAVQMTAMRSRRSYDRYQNGEVN